MTKNGVIINNRPILYIALATLLAILISSVAIVTGTLFSLAIIFLILLVLIVLLFSFISLHKTKLSILFIAIILVFAVVSSNFIYNYSVYNKSEIAGEHYFNGAIYSIGSLYEDEDGNKIRQIVVDGDTSSGKVRAKVNIDGDKEVYVGNTIEFHATFYRSSISYNGEFVVYALSDKIYYSTHNVEELKIHFEINGTFNKIKYKIYSGLKSTMPKVYAIAYAMITGDSSYVSHDLIVDFRATGIAHVFAVSGLHIGLIYSLLYLIYKLFKVKGLARLFITIPVLLLYVAFCGFSPSCLRAFIIIIVSCLANAIYEKEDKLTSLLIAFVLVLMINPFDLFTVGFILSFTVYFSLVFLTKPIYKFLSTFCFDKFAKFLAPYLSAYLASLPLSIDFFGFVSIFSMLFNILFVPILGIVYILVFILSIAILILPFYGVFAIVPNLILSLIVNFITFIETNLFLIGGFTFGVAKIPYYLTFVINAKLINISKKLCVIIYILLIITITLCIFIVNVLI